LAAGTFAVTGCLLLAACGTSSPAARSAAPASKATALATVAPTAPPSADSTPTTDPVGGGTACSLVTEQEVAAALGRDPGAGTAITSHGASQCQYGTFQTSFVLVNLNPTQGKPSYDRAHNSPKVSQAGVLTEVAGVGDRAFGISGHGAASIYFTKGDALVLVMVEILNAPTPPKAQALALAKTAADRV
jgi:hypothetical protein